MGVRVLQDREGFYQALYDSVTMQAFGPLLDFDWDADEFLKWLEQEDARDPRKIPFHQLEAFLAEWQETTQCCGEARTGSGGHAEDCDNFDAALAEEMRGGS